VRSEKGKKEEVRLKLTIPGELPYSEVVGDRVRVDDGELGARGIVL
jgi:hypothetical protein